MFAFLGPNGAGKSTTIDMICTFLEPDSGEVFVNGFELSKQDTQIRSCIGAVFQDGVLDNLLSVRDNLEVRGAFYGYFGKELESRIRVAVQTTDIVELLDHQYGKLSGGQRRRSDVARALINTPSVLFLDEPTTGLDPQTRQSVWETIKTLQTELNMTIFLTTHYMEEASSADYVIVIDEGNIVAKGTPVELKGKYASDKLYLKVSNMEAVSKVLDNLHLNYTHVVDRLVITLKNSLDSLEILDLIRNELTSYELISSSMDDVFIEITGKGIRE